MNITLTLMITKAAAMLSRALGRGGGQALPGLMAERLDPKLAGKLAARLPHGVILVTGTNGKTTTTKMIAAMLEAAGEKVLVNSTGSNLKRGVTSALIAAANGRGELRHTIGLFEVDEANLRLVVPELQPKHIVVLNLFRDQLDRYGELDATAALIGQGIAAADAKLYLNADDPLVASLAKYAVRPELVNYFGIEGLPSKAASAYQTVADSDRCPVCHERLAFSRVFYGHIGHYRCKEGHFTRPQPGVAITGVDETGLEGSRFTVAIHGKRHEVEFSLPGTYNLYNALAAIALGQGVGVAAAGALATLAHTKAAFGRVEVVEVDGRKLYLLLIKNPAGFTQVVETFLAGQPDLKVLFAINDLDADGRDVSWLWDVPLEGLAVGIEPGMITTGMRGADMALRLHYAGVEAENHNNTLFAIQELIKRTPRGGTAYILPTYTAMLEVRKLLSKLTHIDEIS